MSTEQTKHNELVINGIDHSEFDSEWAMRGGIVSLEYQKYSGAWQLYPTVNVLAVPVFRYSHFVFMPFGEHETFGEIISENSRVLSKSMATRAECEAAGVEYIERPVSAEQSAALARLMFAISEKIDNGMCDWEIEDAYEDYHLAMKGGK